MNWFIPLKLAQAWNTKWKDTHFLEDMVKTIYEIEYKLHMIQTKPFEGLPQRKENIITKLEKELELVSKKLQQIFVNVFEGWLKEHAILSPRTWAKQRVKTALEIFDTDFKALIDDFVFELQRYADMNVDLFKLSPTLERVAGRQLLKEYKNILKEDLKDMGWKEFAEIYRLESKEDVKNFFKNIKKEDAIEWFQDIGDDTYLDIIDKIIEEKEGLLEKVLIELYQNALFPVWFNKWEAEGITQTRQTIENIYQKLKNTNQNNTKELIGTINIAINASHQTGSMTDYFENIYDVEYFLGLLEDLTQGQFIEEWNNELKNIGVKI